MPTTSTPRRRRRTLLAAAFAALVVAPTTIPASIPASATMPTRFSRNLRVCRRFSVCIRPGLTPVTTPPTSQPPASVPPSTTPPVTAPPVTAPPPFAADGAFRSRIGPLPALDPKSAAQIASITASGTGIVVGIGDDAVPIYDADASTPRYRVACTVNYQVACDFAATTVPIPDGATPGANSDAPMVVVDRGANRSYEFWQAVPGAAWTTSWGSITPLDGPGNGVGTTGAGISRLAGVIRVDEIRQGRIEHPLVFSTTNACHSYRWPATKSDGSSTRADCLPEGARVQLDPTLDLATLNLRPGERAVADALQRYGAYVIDNGGAPMGFVFEKNRDGTGIAPYVAAGFSWDYWNLGARLPMGRLRVLATWNGA